MSRDLTRRAALSGSALAALGLAATPTLAGPAGPMSPEAAALLGAFHGVARRFNAACERLDAAQTRTGRIPAPDALFARDGDSRLLDGVVPCRHWMNEERRLFYGYDEQIAQLRALRIRPDRRGMAERRDEIVGAWDRWRADTKAAEDASGETAAIAHFVAASEAHEAFLLRLVHMRTADPGVMRIRAAAVLNMWSDDPDRFDDAVDRAVDADGEPEEALCFSLMRDMLHGLGTPYRVAA